MDKKVWFGGAFAIALLPVGAQAVDFQADPVKFTEKALIQCASTSDKLVEVISLSPLKKDVPYRLIVPASIEKLQFRVPRQCAKDGTCAVGSLSGSVEEKKRELRAIAELKDMLKTALSLNPLKSMTEPEDPCISIERQYVRSTVHFVAEQSFPKDEEKKGAKTTGTEGAVAEPVKLAHDYEIIVGPRESFYWSADLPLTSINQVTYDASSGKFQEKERPAKFYASLNWKALGGDVFSEYSAGDFSNNVALKFMVQASSRPTSSMGVGLGYPMDMLGVPVELFVAHVWTKDEDGTPGEAAGRTESTAFGISFNISKGIDWYKESKKSKEKEESGKDGESQEAK